MRTTLLLLWLALLQTLTPLHPALAQESADKQAKAGGITIKTCDPVDMCFPNVQARQDWAKAHNCQFLEDLCEGTPPHKDNAGAKEEDKGFWGDLWDSVKGGLVYGYEFVKGLMHGLKEQVTDLVDLAAHPVEAMNGLIALGKAFYEDPAGTLEKIAEMLGQEAVNDIKRATQCGAYDLGKVLGKHVNPAAALKLALKLTKYSGKLADAIKGLRHEHGCASFAAGTPVLTPSGLAPIEQIRAGQQVRSRSDRNYADAAQTVTHVFSRTAPNYRLVKTEFDSFKVTDEHPLWVQGKGWTQAQHLTSDDVIAGAQTDVLGARQRTGAAAACGLQLQRRQDRQLLCRRWSAGMGA